MVSLPSPSPPPLTLDASPYSSTKLTNRPRRLKDAERELNTSRAILEPGYVRAVIAAYIEAKRHGGSSKPQIHYKLLVLQSRLPHFAADFHAVRLACDLPRTRGPPPPERIEIYELGPPPYKQCTCPCTCAPGTVRNESDSAALLPPQA